MTAVSVQPDLAGSPHFRYQNGVLHAEDVPLDSLAAQLGTPLYVYSRAALRSAWETYRDAIGERPVLVCFGMKTNSNLVTKAGGFGEQDVLIRAAQAIRERRFTK